MILQRRIRASTFLPSETGHPKIAFLYQDRSDAPECRLSSYRLTEDDQGNRAGRFDAARGDRELDLDVADPGASLLIPVPKVEEEVKRHNVRNPEQARAHLGGLMVVGNVVIYAFGVAGLMASTGMGVGTALAKGVAPFLVGDLIKIAVAAALLPAAWKLVGARRG